MASFFRIIFLIYIFKILKHKTFFIRYSHSTVGFGVNIRRGFN